MTKIYWDCVKLSPGNLLKNLIVRNYWHPVRLLEVLLVSAWLTVATCRAFPQYFEMWSRVTKSLFRVNFHFRNQCSSVHFLQQVSCPKFLP